MRLQAENLEKAAHSRVASRVTSRIGSIAPSLIASAIQSRRASRPLSNKTSNAASRRGSISNYLPVHSNAASEGTPETLENLIRMTQNQDSILQTYYTNDQGEVVTLSLYDISDTDPADILGNDVIAQPQDTYENTSQDTYENLDFNEEVARKISNIRRRSVQISGDSNFGM